MTPLPEKHLLPDGDNEIVWFCRYSRAVSGVKPCGFGGKSIRLFRVGGDFRNRKSGLLIAKVLTFDVKGGMLYPAE